MNFKIFAVLSPTCCKDITDLVIQPKKKQTEVKCWIFISLKIIVDVCLDYSEVFLFHYPIVNNHTLFSYLVINQ
ncbi:hypothetical protein ACVWYN_001201 [Pedobacter sp. UYP24]